MINFNVYNVNQARNNEWCFTTLYCITKGHVDTVKVLIEAGGNVNQAIKMDHTALSTSSQHGHLEVVRLLLQQPNIDVNKGAEGWSPLALAKHGNHAEIVQLLKDAGAQ